MRKIILLMFVLAGLSACNKDDDAPATQNLTLSITNLEASAPDEAYEGWVVVNGAPVSTGTFSVDANGTMSQTTFPVDAAMLAAATTFVLSIEPVPDSDPSPSAIKILGGDFAGNSASVNASHGAALGEDLSVATGNAILATPTTTTTCDELSGIWFLNLSGGSPATGLSLPTLPSGWKYEGWAVIDGTPVTSGTFSAVDVADDAAPFSGPGNGPPFPGEDYVANAPTGMTFPTDLSNATLVISIEPNPDNSASPFMFKPLVVTLAGATDHVTYEMSNMSANFPAGTASR